VLHEPQMVLAYVAFLIEIEILTLDRFAAKEVSPRRAQTALSAHLFCWALLAATRVALDCYRTTASTARAKKGAGRAGLRWLSVPATGCRPGPAC
jgi:hypothetical protein